MGVLSRHAVQTSPSDADRPALVEVRRARDEQRRVRGPPCATDLGHVGAYATSRHAITTRPL